MLVQNGAYKEYIKLDKNMVSIMMGGLIHFMKYLDYSS